MQTLQIEIESLLILLHEQGHGINFKFLLEDFFFKKCSTGCWFLLLNWKKFVELFFTFFKCTHCDSEHGYKMIRSGELNSITIIISFSTSLALKILVHLKEEKESDRYGEKKREKKLQ